MKAIRYERDERGFVTLTIDMPGQATNTMNALFRESLAEVVQKLEAEREQIRGVVLTSGKPTFFAGGDLKDLLAVPADQAALLYTRSLQTKAIMRRFELLGKPVVAAINGSALGGGFELCLACHARFAVRDPRLMLGLPETTLGLIPGAGGIPRLTRLIGLEAATELILEGRTFGPAAALDMKLLNGVVDAQEDLLEAARRWIDANPSAKQPWDATGRQAPASSDAPPAEPSWLRAAPARLLAKHASRYPALEAALCAAIEGSVVDFEAASRIESRYLAKVATGPVAKTLINTMFFQMNTVKGGGEKRAASDQGRVQRVAVVGAGLMGSGIAQVAASKGLDVVLVDRTEEQAQAGKNRIAATLAKAVNKGKMDDSKAGAVLERIHCGAADMPGCEIIIEAVFEDRELKGRITREFEPLLASDGIFASNTSTLPIGGLASASANPKNFIGLHFFSPVDRMPLVEVVKGPATSPQTVARSLAFVRQLGKVPIVVNDSRGFFTSRVFGSFTREGAAMLDEGINAALIEHAAHQAGMPVGPLTVMDEVSMTLTAAVRRQTIADFEAEGRQYQDPPGWNVVDKMLTVHGRPGRAGGGGFYDYFPDGSKRLWPGLAAAFSKSSADADVQDLVDRFLFVQALEAIRAMEEGVIESVAEANVGSILGIGYPRWTGGVLQFVNMTGLAAFVQRAEQLAARQGARFQPPTLLRERAARLEPFL